MLNGGAITKRFQLLATVHSYRTLHPTSFLFLSADSCLIIRCQQISYVILVIQMWLPSGVVCRWLKIQVQWAGAVVKVLSWWNCSFLSSSFPIFYSCTAQRSLALWISWRSIQSRLGCVLWKWLVGSWRY